MRIYKLKTVPYSYYLRIKIMILEQCRSSFSKLNKKTVHCPLSKFLSTVHCPAILSWSGGGGTYIPCIYIWYTFLPQKHFLNPQLKITYFCHLWTLNFCKKCFFGVTKTTFKWVCGPQNFILDHFLT